MSSLIPNIIHESWHPYLEPLFKDARMDKLKHVTLIQKPFYPIREHIFRVFSMPLDSIKVVILGQDVYHNGQGIGFAFAVESTTPIPPSLEVIRGEIARENDEDIIELDLNFTKDFSWRTLAHWRKQGVFLLNTALTVERGIPNSHTEHWKFFTREVIHLISTKVKPIWLLWGSKAQSFESYINNRLNINSQTKIEEASGINNYNLILKAPHPAAQLYPSSTVRFTGCKHFYLTNKILEAKGLETIKW